MIGLLEPLYWNWYVLGLGLVALELLLPGVYVIWFGIGALACGVLAQAFPDLGWPVQVVAFCGISTVSLFVGRRVIRRARPSDTTTLNRRLHQYVGRRAVLESPVVNGAGRIRLDDTFWIVECAGDPGAGTRVVVTGVRGSRLVIALDGDGGGGTGPET
ncbi:NfeD family protein [Phaeovibrio sulfidiphilus]|uniref:NfeD family protein n=1 Tax=Phaeovibrio sulfidiphilus TaxID=1220600 RepID=A0A8J7CVY6_9PROT|nr:NfeD family protein [Phaeovibrio sulfidiphilus]MBE1236871.1 NfeD family protein [Phaeovibrio sulfidiphilus]